jgi:hypothetical protein
MPVFALAFGFVGTAILVRWCVREVQRVNTERDAASQRPAAGAIDRQSLPTLRRDPDTGEYRPG